MSEWGQLVYTSVDAGQFGGWQVKQCSPQLTEQTVNALVARVPTALELVAEPSPFPTPAEIAALPRRLLYAGLADDRWRRAWWHSTPAGADASGRTGNVFTQCLVSTEQVRPISLWRSPGWSTPFGAAEVAASTLGMPPEPQQIVPIASQLLFGTDSWQVGTLCVLADALQAARQGGPTVVLLVDDPDEGAAWLMALSLCISVQAAAGMGFSTFERASAHRGWQSGGLQVVCVPRADAHLLGAGVGCQLDPRQAPAIGFGGQPHLTHRGQPIEPTELSGLIMELAFDAETFAAMTARLDEVVAQAGEESVELAWPLAMVASLDGQASETAARVLARATPERALCDARCQQLVRDALTARMGSSTERSWQVLIETRQPSLTRLATDSYLAAAVCDPAWLAEPGLTRIVPTDSSPTPHTAELVDREVAGLVARDDPRVPFIALRLLDMLCAVGWQRPGRLEAAALSLAERAVVPALCLPTTQFGLQCAGRLTDATRELLVRLLADTQIRRPPNGPALSVDSLRLLGLDRGEQLTDPEFVQTPDGELRPLAIEVARFVCYHPDGQPDQRVQAAARAVLVQAELLLGRRPPHELLATALPADAVAEWIADRQIQVPPDLIVRALLENPDDQATIRLAEVALRQCEGQVGLAAGLRYADEWQLPTEAQLDLAAGHAANLPVADDVVARIALGIVVSLIKDKTPPAAWAQAVIRQARPLPRVLAERWAGVLCDQFDSALGAVRWLLAIHPDSPSRRLLDEPLADWLAWLPVQEEPGRRFLDVLAHGILVILLDRERSAQLPGTGYRPDDRFLKTWYDRQSRANRLGLQPGFVNRWKDAP